MSKLKIHKDPAYNTKEGAVNVTHQNLRALKHMQIEWSGDRVKAEKELLSILFEAGRRLGTQEGDR